MRKQDNGTLLEIRDLKTYFFMEEGVIRAVDGVAMTIHDRECHGVVGESGCGKSVTALSVLQLIQQPPGEIVSGEIRFAEWGDLMKLSKKLKLPWN